MRTLMSDSSKEKVDRDDGDDTGSEDPEAGAKKFASISLHEDQRVRLVDGRLHPVDDDAGDGDVEPDGPGIAGEFAVRRKAPGEREEKRNEDHRQSDDREKDVGEQELPVERPPRAQTVEVGFSMESEVDQVRDQENGGEDKGREHRGAVLGDLACSDESIAEEQGDRRESIEDCIDERKRTELGSGDIGRGVKVDQPADESAGGGTEKDDGCNDGRGSPKSSWWRCRACVHQKSKRPFASSMRATISKGR